MLNWIKSKLSKVIKNQSVTSQDLYEYIFNLRYGRNTSAGISVSEETALTFSAVYACIKILSEDIAKLPLVVYENLQGGGKRKATNHIFYKMFGVKPNSFQTRFEWVEMMIAHMLLRGNSFSFKNKVGGVTKQLIPLHPDRVEIEQEKDFTIKYKITGNESGEELIFTDKEIFHLRGLTLNGFSGVTPIKYAKETIGLGLAGEKFGSTFFKNGARPSSVISTPERLEKEAAKRFKKSLEDALTGEKQHSVLVLEEGMEWKQMSLTNEDAQFLQSRKFQVIETLRFYRVPPHKVFDLERSTFNNIEQSSQDYVVDSLLPITTRFENRINCDFFPDGRYFVKFNLNSLLRGLLETRSKFYVSMVQNGIFNANEVRELEEMNPRDGGDEYLTPKNMSVGEIENEN